jgi:hypothetical protein
MEYYPSNKYNNRANKKLNKYGKGPFCRFRIPNTLNSEGVYIIKVNNDIMYIGECENLSRRFNLGYGLISPRNCFVGGQSTNCKINSYILQEMKNGSKVYLFFYETGERFKIESKLIKKYKPEWNANSGKYINSVGKKSVNTRRKEVNDVGNISKYYPLEKFLNIQNVSRIELTFCEIEKIIGEALPPSAYKYRAWWANGGHSQANAWLNAGWRVDNIKLGDSILFAKNSE